MVSTGKLAVGLALLAGAGIGGYLLYKRLTQPSCDASSEGTYQTGTDGICRECVKDFLGYSYAPVADSSKCSGGGGGGGGVSPPVDCTAIYCQYDECVGADYYYGGAPDPTNNCACKYASVLKNAPTCVPRITTIKLTMNELDVAALSGAIAIAESYYDWCGLNFLPKSPESVFEVTVLDQWARPMQGVQVLFGMDRNDIGGYLWANCIRCGVEVGALVTDANGQAQLNFIVTKDHGAGQVVPVTFYVKVLMPDGTFQKVGGVVDIHCIGAYLYGFATDTVEGQCSTCFSNCQF